MNQIDASTEAVRPRPRGMRCRLGDRVLLGGPRHEHDGRRRGGPGRRSGWYAAAVGSPPGRPRDDPGDLRRLAHSGRVEADRLQPRREGHVQDLDGRLRARAGRQSCRPGRWSERDRQQLRGEPLPDLGHDSRVRCVFDRHPSDVRRHGRVGVRHADDPARGDEGPAEDPHRGCVRGPERRWLGDAGRRGADRRDDQRAARGGRRSKLLLWGGGQPDSILIQFEQASDILSDGSNSAGQPCNAISVGMQFWDSTPFDGVLPVPDACPAD